MNVTYSFKLAAVEDKEREEVEKLAELIGLYFDSLHSIEVDDYSLTHIILNITVEEDGLY